ncbi:MAG: hypothetical protein KatS3mg126_0429 [Lysobacteraceae bacterium]|nr:MAG: hypothetical protein KatS3mg126_0429 [Xanthomonadaceae bacterium]
MQRTSAALAAAIAALLASGSAAAQNTPSMEEMWRLIQQQQAEIQALRTELEQARQSVRETGQDLAETRQQVEQTREAVTAATSEVESLRASSAGAADWAASTHLGGYGELHYNAGKADEIDFHRFVLFFAHRFSDTTRFNSELEVEHTLAGEGKPGEVELEQAYIEHDLAPGLRGRAGLFLVPVGLLNEVHEPTTFYGVERNPVESQILPTTWWEAGLSLQGEFENGLGWDAAMHSGLATGAGSHYAVRSGRKKVAKAPAEDAAYTLRLRYQVPGLQLAAGYQHQSDVTQGQDPTAGAADLFTAHADWSLGRFGLRALWARWHLDGAGPAAVGADVQKGYYVEPSFRITPRVGVFARWNEWDNRAGDSADSRWRQTDVGINYWLHPNVVLKADYQFQDAPAGLADDDRLNLGVGYQF